MTFNYDTYWKTAKGKYVRQKSNAMNRFIPWQFTFETWWKVWEDSGKWEQRGRGVGKYCMSRIDDYGAYCPENVIIQSYDKNSSDGNKKRWVEKKMIKMEDWVHTDEGMNKYWFSLLGT